MASSTPAISDEQIFELASEAVRAMLQKFGPAHRFPADLIWQHIPNGVVIPSRRRPHQPKKLVDAGLLSKTGGMTRALSDARNGAPTSEYRFGPVLLSKATAGDSHEGGVGKGKLLASLKEKMEADGYLISVAELANFFLALSVSPIVILSGISGTGKSVLPRKFAELSSSSFFLIPVQPQWADNSDLFGYVPTLAPQTYCKGAIIDAIQYAIKKPEELVIAVLDEMNLAHVEHYFSDFLSVSETRRREGGLIVTDRKRHTASISVVLAPIPWASEVSACSLIAL